jgi:hypothetical protein
VVSHLTHLNSGSRLPHTCRKCDTAQMSYASVTKVARSLLLPACCLCGSTAHLCTELKPYAPKANLRYDAGLKMWYSVDASDYRTVCRSCHRRRTERVRKARRRGQCARREAAPLCDVCRQPMLVGQRGAHLSCAMASAS